ncbi:gamma-glutamylcyclotransferase [Methylonatrum kenyense]|uniref:gamma-glutamylcyclotransferase family protein n=1 Tax=Methylonatrum kenyense TaxID=455253 RepID=UPI0020C04297|nr:gamma-glutamylcyclotransferase family protein [Methylonatrum kenyense]MCK8515659.1 gamma-glutamylcyclotransferase [Methylonatrum kenyense]
MAGFLLSGVSIDGAGAVRVFVYGTLRKGQANHGQLRSAEFLGRHRTEPEFRMLDLGPYPGVARGGRTAITGEVYAINQTILVRLDRLEDYPQTYDRERLATPWGPAFIYLYRWPTLDSPTVASGDWPSHRARRS